MNDSKTPDWMLEIQNKSWEPEILISGITLTSLFILSNYIYNFYGMLVQDFAVYEVIAKSSYRVSIILLTGFKIGLIFHLILRGIWTGLIGLSYVFPDGIKKQNLSKYNKNLDCIKPETFIMKVEKNCSLLFSIIFSLIMFVIGFFLLFIPIIVLFLIGLDIFYIHVLTLYVIVPLTMILAILSIIFSKKFKTSKFNKRIENSTFNYMHSVLFTNIGKLKTSLIFVVYFLIIFLISFSDITKFDFKNRKTVEDFSSTNIVYLNKDHYESFRDHNLRIPKATIEKFRIPANTIELFISYFKEDIYTIKKLETSPELLKKFNIDSSNTKISFADLYKITIDDELISGLRWYSTENIYTDQKGFILTIPLDTSKDGYHKLKIHKIYWSIKKNEMELLKNWEIIPFETGNKTNIAIGNKI
ncbi:MAG: hypothetical protein K8R79_08700 [Calditrichales bacterium]|nr:hypothetical protein [Calditrichales bacterium]